MTIQRLLFATLLLALYGCGPQAPEQKVPPAPTAAVAAAPAPAAKPSVEPVTTTPQDAVPSPAPALAPAKTATAQAKKEPTVSTATEKAQPSAAAPKKEKAVSPTSAPVAAPTPTTPVKSVKIDTSKLTKIDLKLGDGALATAGKNVSAHYSGWLFDEAKPEHKGAKFDSSYFRGTPIEFSLGAGQLIAGWDQGIEGMKVGGKRTLIIPSALAYGERGMGGLIPPNSVLVFDIELLGVR